MTRPDRAAAARTTPGEAVPRHGLAHRSPARRRGAALITVLTAVLTAAPLAACTTPSHVSPVTHASGHERGGARPAGPPLVPGISGPPAIDANPYAGSAGRKVRPHITLSSIPPAGSAAPVALPLDAYIQTSVQQDQTLSAAAAQVAQRCMSAAGFSHPVEPKADDQTILDQFIERRDGGLTSLTQARSFGFQLPPGILKFPTKVDTPLPSFAAEQRKHGAAWASALLGAVPGAKAGESPLGCLRAANTLLFGNLNGDLGGAAVAAVLGGAYEWAGSDPHVLAVQRAWSACMARQGLHYNSSVALEWNRTWPNPPTPAETTAAVADVRCNQQTNLANTYLTVEAAYQQALLGQNAAAVQRMQADFVTMQRRGEQVLRLPSADLLRLSRVRVSQASSLLVPRQ